MLRVFRGKRLMVVEQRALLTARCRVQIIAAGATIVGPVSSVSQVLQTLEAGEVDAAIIDAEVDEETMMHLAMLLDAMKVPFVFASVQRGDSAGYVLSDDMKQLRKIADALFGRPGPSSTLH
ncbi:hypothetical protein G6L59_24815 [Agrobacterium tumefaciens]|nr:hypothetical protein At1D1460_48970 [Agrobacterium tumefaciens]NSZ35618.1 hypothetical protein [Agrobacterium tumefaciens]QLG25608.1 hypothetical protein EML4_25065 [Agrobacterium tumefaciens]UXS89414.1 hypothetical protein FY144_24635 [Agrobacterium tumefaciens]